jgi:type I restriction enzyme S subunit
MSFPRYPTYKDSGVRWLGAIPAHWGVGQSRRLFGLRNQQAHDSDQQLTASQDHGVIYQDDFVRLEGRRVVQVIKGADILKHVEPNDFVISMRSFQGGIEWCNLRGSISSAYVMLVPCKKLHSPFFAYLFKSRNYIQALQSTSNLVRDGQALRYANFTQVDLPLVPIDEQAAIAAFLDRETAKIDALIAEQQRLIELLQEKRQAVISHAVTKGLNPDAPMKDSGIEWLGEVPEHWGFGPLKRFWEVIDCKHVTVPFLDEGFPVASVMEVREFELDLSQVLRTSEEHFRLLTDGGRQPRRGDVIYCRNTANTGTSAYVGTDEPISIGQDVVLIKSTDHNGRFLNYILHSGLMATQLETLLVGSTFKRINVAEIRSLAVTCPPTAEQDAIAAFLDARTSDYKALSADASRAIGLLQERRSALISAAVTGQIDIRGLLGSDAA